MPRRLRIPPLQRDILMTLEEAGSETLHTPVATVNPTSQSEVGVQVDEPIMPGLIRKEKGRSSSHCTT